MSTTAASSSAWSSAKRRTPNFTAKLLASGAILAIALAFVFKYVFRYYLHYDQAAFSDPVRGAANYWAMRGWLLMHMTGGMVALLTGPWQFWTGFRSRYARVHRWTGRAFCVGLQQARWARSEWQSAQLSDGRMAFGCSVWRSLGSQPPGWPTTRF
jgi:hypothetical protein